METTQNDSLKSGYQARPLSPPSAGRALSVLIAVCAVLWVWLMLPEWWLVESDSQLQQQVIKVMFSAYILGPLVIALNSILLLYTTRPMWRGGRLTLLEDVKRGFVLLLCLLFHLLTPPAAFLLAAAIAMD